MSNQSKPLADYIRNLGKYIAENDEKETGLIVYADDQFINQELMKMNISDIKI